MRKHYSLISEKVAKPATELTGSYQKNVERPLTSTFNVGGRRCWWT
jgi:hypothetical protein